MPRDMKEKINGCMKGGMKRKKEAEKDGERIKLK